MIKKRDLVMAVLITFCLTASMFLVQLTRSQTLGQYDPWFDMDSSGKIDVYDVAWVAKAFGTSGDPTKNVNVTNWPLDASGNLRTSSSGVSATNYLTALLEETVGGSSAITILVNSSEVHLGGKNLVVIGGDISGGSTWSYYANGYWMGTSWAVAATGGFSQATARAEFYDSNGTIVGVFSLPMTHEISMSNVDVIRLVIEVPSPYNYGMAPPNGQQIQNTIAAATATIYWAQS